MLRTPGCGCAEDVPRKVTAESSAAVTRGEVLGCSPLGLPCRCTCPATAARTASSDEFTGCAIGFRYRDDP
jgi:hypothetical protein